MPAVTCPSCHKPIQWQSVSPDGSVDGECPSCESPLYGTLFPKLHGEPERRVPTGSDLPAAKAACYNHPAKEAVAACDQCGRFLCALCELPVEGKLYCPSCMEKMDQEGHLRMFKRRETRHDSVSLALAFLPLIIWPLTIVTAPLTLLYIWKYWSTPNQSILRRTRWRFYVAGLCALAQCAGWSWVLYMFITRVVR